MYLKKKFRLKNLACISEYTGANQIKPYLSDPISPVICVTIFQVSFYNRHSGFTLYFASLLFNCLSIKEANQSTFLSLSYL